MSDPANAKVTAANVYRLLDQLHVYVGSSQAKIVPQKGAPDSCGNYVYLDGESFLAGFIDYLNNFEQEPKEILEQLSAIMELSIYVRNGGSKAISYRLETGSVTLSQDFYDSIAKQLCLVWDGEKSFSPTLSENNANLISRLKQIDPDDESRVSAAIAEIDQLLLEINRKLEEVSNEKVKQGLEPDTQNSKPDLS